MVEQLASVTTALTELGIGAAAAIVGISLENLSRSNSSNRHGPRRKPPRRAEENTEENKVQINAREEGTDIIIGDPTPPRRRSWSLPRRRR